MKYKCFCIFYWLIEIVEIQYIEKYIIVDCYNLFDQFCVNVKKKSSLDINICLRVCFKWFCKNFNFSFNLLLFWGKLKFQFFWFFLVCCYGCKNRDFKESCCMVGLNVFYLCKY